MADFSALMADAAATAVADETPASTAKPGQPQTSPTAAIYVSKEPSRDEIDWSKPNADTLYVKDMAWLKGKNKLVTWHPKFAPKP